MWPAAVSSATTASTAALAGPSARTPGTGERVETAMRSGRPVPPEGRAPPPPAPRARAARSATVVASAPFTAMPDQSSNPMSAGTTPRPGLSVTRPQAAAGRRREPMPSLPWASGTLPGGDRRRAAAGAAGRRPRGVPGVAADGARAVGRGVEAELGRPGDADDDGSGGAQPGDDGVVGRLRHLRRRRRPVGADLAGHGHVVLDRDRHAGQREGAAVGRRVDRGRLDQRGRPPDDAEGPDTGVDRRDVLQVGADDVDRRELPRPHPCRDLRGR